jgi:methionyl-tRNA formyltransferase
MSIVHQSLITNPQSLSTVFMGTPAFALPSLRALHAAGHAIVAVYSQPPRPAGRGQKETPSPVHAFALEHNIPVFTPASLKTPEAQAQFAAHKADVAVVAAYGLLLPKPILEAYPHGCINVHPSLLPRWRGAAPIQRTVMAGDDTTGVCIMQMDEGLDTGDVILRQEGLAVGSMDAGALHDMLSQLAGPLLLLALDAIARGAAGRTPQAAEGVTYAKKITKDEARIDWSRPAHELYNHIRGLSPTPGAHFTMNGENIKIFKAELAQAGGSPGAVLDDVLTIACGSASLRPLEVQRPNKKRMDTAEMLKGFPIAPGTVVQ